MRKRSPAAILLLLNLCLLGCNASFQNWQFRSANKLAAEKKFKEAVDLYARVMRRGHSQPLAIEAARTGARFAAYEVRDYDKAADFYKHIILYSKDTQERLSAQSALVEIYFDKLRNFDQALVELNHLIPLVSYKERLPLQLKVARSYFNLNNLSQALIEVEDLLTKKMSSDLRFDALVFKGNILQASKRIDEAIAVFKNVQDNYRTRSEAENIGMSLAICYEEKNELKTAVDVLEQMKKHNQNPEFIQIRINRLKERMANLPGAGGFKR